MISYISRIMLIFSMAFVLSAPQVMASQVVVEEKPSALAMTGDLLLVRPVMAVITVVGSGIFLLSLPFSLLGGNAGEAANTLVSQPAKTTFVRCLGCKNPGYKKRVEQVQGNN